jgi:pyruvate dehydrogenase E2 component (dihydrolipoamide acetyltransferase)
VPFDVVVPQIGEAISELRVAGWLKKVGDHVEVGEPLFEVDSDKAVVEVESVVSGTLTEVLSAEDAAVMPQQVVARIRLDGEAESEEAPDESDDLDRPAEAGGDAALGGSRAGGFDPGPSSSEVPRAHTKVRASPKARRRARELGIELEGVVGSGPNGLITVDDLTGVVPHHDTERLEEASVALDGPTFADLPKLRQVVARRMLASKQQIPHFYLSVDVDMQQLGELRDYCREILAWERAPSYTDIVVHACALTLVTMPELNVSYTDRLIRRDEISIGLAVAAEEGLTVPVLPNAAALTLAETAVSLRGLAERARAGRLKQADTGSKSMVVSNLGMFGVDSFAAIIDTPDPMILSMGRVKDCVVAVAGSPRIRPMATFGLSVDHRVLDGVQGARFLAQLKHRLEQPFDILGSARS